MRILLELSYLGTHFAGFQVQPGCRTVQGVLQDALEAVYGERYPLRGCSRTDAGVHALQFLATYDTECAVPTDRIPAALNAQLPPDLAVHSARTVSEDFHVRHDIHGKEYEYRIRNAPGRDPFTEGRVCRIRKVLDDAAVARMKKAAAAFVGTHDFAGFMSAGSSVTDTVRTVYHLEIGGEGEHLLIRIAADGFLYNMVRIIAGTLIEVGNGRIDPDEMPDIIASCDRSRAGYTAPAEGLYLRRVFLEDRGED